MCHATHSPAPHFWHDLLLQSPEYVHTLTGCLGFGMRVCGAGQLSCRIQLPLTMTCGLPIPSLRIFRQVPSPNDRTRDRMKHSTCSKEKESALQRRVLNARGSPARPVIRRWKLGEGGKGWNARGARRAGG